MKIFSIIIISFIASRGICIAQAKEAKPSKIFLSTGFGAAGSFYVRDYDEALPFPSSYYKAFFKKNFVGIAREIAIGLHLKKNIDLKIGFNHQRFTRKVYVNDTLSRGVGLFLDNRIQHADNMWFGGMAKNYNREKSQFSWGTGIFFWSAQQQTVEIFTNYIIDQEFNGRLDELGAYAELAYEYKFQPKVNIGLKAQVWYIVSGSYFNTVALFPFIKLNF